MQVTPVGIVLLCSAEAAITFYFFPQVYPGASLSAFFVLFSCIHWSAFIFYHLIIYPFFRSPLRHLPTPATGFWPIIGHGLISFKRPLGATHLKMMKETPNDGLVRFYSFFHHDRLLLTTPTALADVLVHRCYDFEKPQNVREFLAQILGQGLLMSEGEEHKHQRKTIMPAFSFRHIKDLYPVFWSKSIELCDVVKAELWDKSDKKLEFTHYSTQVAMDIIGLAGLGRDNGSLRNSNDELVNSYEEILEPTPEKGLYFVSHLLFPMWLLKSLPWKLNERMRINAEILKRTCTDFVKEKKSRMKTESKEHVDILSIMIRANNFSDEGLVDQLLTFLAAGHETTASALTWAAHLLSIHPEIQARLRTEIHAAIPDPKALLDPGFDIATVLESLTYLNAVCNETLRLFPSLPVSSRVTVRDTSINGQFVPKGTLCIMAPWAFNRSPDFWGPDSEDFKPERWIDAESGRATNNGGADSNYAFLTFLHGPRSCIGERFARAELRALIGAFCGTFEMEMADPNEIVQLGGVLTIKPINGMKLRVKPVAWGA